jgi:hypothetical protein
MVTAVNGLIAITVMAFAGNVSAASYDIQDGNILAIGNLELNFDNDELDGFYNITFVTDTGVGQYGDANFDFDLSENGVTAWPQITDAVNAAPEAVTGASDTGSDTFFIPLVDVPLFDIWGAVGSEIIDGTWKNCESECILLGVAALRADGVNTFARVTAVPEPGTALLLGLGLAVAGLGTIRRSKQQESKATA